MAKAQHAAFVALQQPLHQPSRRRAGERSGATTRVRVHSACVSGLLVVTETRSFARHGTGRPSEGSGTTGEAPSTEQEGNFFNKLTIEIICERPVRPLHAAQPVPGARHARLCSQCTALTAWLDSRHQSSDFFPPLLFKGYIIKM